MNALEIRKSRAMSDGWTELKIEQSTPFPYSDPAYFGKNPDTGVYERIPEYKLHKGKINRKLTVLCIDNTCIYDESCLYGLYNNNGTFVPTLDNHTNLRAPKCLSRRSHPNNIKQEAIMSDKIDGTTPSRTETVGYPLTDEDKAELQKRFTYHSPRDTQPKRYNKLREHGGRLAEDIMYNCPPSRERSLALTKLEEAVMWANAAIARNE